MSYYGIDNDFEDEITGIPEDFEDDLEIELIARKIESVVAPLQKDLQCELENYKSKFIDIEIPLT